MQKPRIIAIIGQTATGKSDFAVKVARAIDGEVISADSRQVYTGLDLGTGKITKREMHSIPHHLLDVANPKRQFSVADYARLGNKAIKEILDRERVPIICGGTGLYADALIHGIILPEVPPNPKLRAQLAKLSVEKLFAALKKLDPLRAKAIDSKNPVRLIRAIEIATVLGSVPKTKSNSEYRTLQIGFALPREVLKEKISIRLTKRLKTGMLREAQRLHTGGLSWKRLETLGLEYRYMARHLQGKITKQEMTEQLANEIFQYAKRQETWFKRDKNILWIDPRKKTDWARALRAIQTFLK